MSDAYNEDPIDNSSNDNSLIDTELQVRLMNLVMGEASDFERDQLQLMMEQHPELAAYCKHLEHLHGLLSEVGAGEPSIDVDAATDDAEWRLPADRRERVLSLLENRISNPPPKVTLANQRSFRNWRITTMEAIVVASVACVILGLMLPATQSAREAGRRLSSVAESRYEAFDLVPPPPPANRPAVIKALNAVLPASEPGKESSDTNDLYVHPNSFARNEVTSELAVLKDNTDSMSITNGIAVAGQTLPSPYYLSDDVQYFRASPENKMASEPTILGTVDRIAVQKGREAYGETQPGEMDFLRAAVDGENQMARRRTTAAEASEVNGPSLPGGTTSVAASPNNSIATDKRYIPPPVPSPNFSDIVSLDQVNVGATPPSVAVGLSSGVAGAAAPAFTTDLDFQIRNNFGVTPAFGAPDSGAADVSNMPDSAFSSFLAYRDPQNNIGSKEGKVASEAAKSKIADKFAVQEGRQAVGEQPLGERNFGGLAANGENDLSRRGVTSRVAADDIDGISSSVGLGFDRSAESMPMSGELANKPGSVEHWAIEKSDSKKLWDSAADPKGQNSYWNDTQKTDRYTSEFESPKSDVATWELRVAEANRKPFEATDSEASFSVAESESSNRSVTINGLSIPGIRNKISKSGQEDRVERNSKSNVNSEQVLAQTEEVWQKRGVRRMERFGDIVQSPRLQGNSEEESKLDSTKSATITDADGDSITLGGIRLNSETKSESESSTLMRTVTPRVIIPEEEEEPLGVGPLAPSPTIALRDRAELKEDAKTTAPRNPRPLNEQPAQTGKESPEPSSDIKEYGYPLTNRLNPNGTKEIVMDIAGRGITQQQNADYVAGGRINVSPTPGEFKNEEVRDRKSKTAPSPELATNGRDGVNAEGKPVAPKQPVTVDEQSAAAEAFSTFSLHVSDVSFKLAQAALSQSQWPEPAKIRIEEFVNALDYHDPLPSGDQKIACRVEQAVHPFLMQRNLLRVSMRTAAAGRSQNTPLRLTLLLDNSGSMERPDRRQAVLRAFQTLTQQLKATDQITLISFASSPRLLADKVPGNQGETLLKLIESLPSEGGTNIESALQLAREKAAEQQVAGAQNRIVLLTDGAVNLGDANPENLARQVTQMRDSGIAFDAAGISAQDLNDEVLEALTRQGDGRYYLLDSAEAASDSFAAQIAGSLRPSAQNVKVQVEFNPQRVGRYKLLGYEKHRLNKEDFRNDQVDAAEMAAAEAGVAVYQYEIKPKGSGDVGSVSVRFRDLSTGQMVERRWPILYESNTPRLEQSQPSMQLAAAAALFAAKLGGGPLADSVDLPQIQKIVARLPEQFASQPRAQQLRAMIEQAIAIH